MFLSGSSSRAWRSNLPLQSINELFLIGSKTNNKRSFRPERNFVFPWRCRFWSWPDSRGEQITESFRYAPITANLSVPGPS